METTGEKGKHGITRLVVVCCRNCRDCELRSSLLCILVVGDAKVTCPAIVHNPDALETMSGVMPYTEDDLIFLSFEMTTWLIA